MLCIQWYCKNQSGGFYFNKPIFFIEYVNINIAICLFFSDHSERRTYAYASVIIKLIASLQNQPKIVWALIHLVAIHSAAIGHNRVEIAIFLPEIFSGYHREDGKFLDHQIFTTAFDN